MEFCCKYYTFFIFLKFSFILAGIWYTFATMSHLNVITVAYWGSNFSKKHCFYSWPVYAAMIFEKKIHLAEWGAFYQMGKFLHFQGSISSLCLKIWLPLSLLTFRNSYFIYPKNVFSMTLNLNIKVKWHFGYLFFLSPQKVSQNCLKTYLITKN